MLPVKLIDRSLLMPEEDPTRTLVELKQIGKTSSGADFILHHAPEPFDGVEVMPTTCW